MVFSAQTFKNANLTGRSQVFYQTGLYHLTFRARSYHWIPGKYDDDVLWCSISFCQGDHQIGWWWSDDHIGQQRQWSGWEYGDSLVIGCANNFADYSCPGPLATNTAAMMPVIKVSQTPKAATETNLPVAMNREGSSSGSAIQSSTFQTSVSQTSVAI